MFVRKRHHVYIGNKEIGYVRFVKKHKNWGGFCYVSGIWHYGFSYTKAIKDVLDTYIEVTENNKFSKE